MKMRASSSRRSRQRGYASVAMVAIVGMITLFGMLVTYRDAIRSQDSEKRSQLRIDYVAKEDALLRALVATIPNRAIDAMRDGSQARASSLTWEAIFNDAIRLANAETAVSAEVLTQLGIDGVVANPGDQAVTNTSDLVGPVVGGTGFVNPGISQSTALLMDQRFTDRLPDPLEAAGSVSVSDQVYPIVSTLKTFSPAWNTEADLSVSQYPLYNRIIYPNVAFGLTAPGSRFVGKRNWWAFSVKFGGQNQPPPTGGTTAPNSTGAPPVLTKNYVVSLYEMPSQHPIAADTYMKVGQHGSGVGWQNIDIRGGINGTVLETEGALSLPTGRFSGRRGMSLDAGASAEGRALRSDFDALGVRESIYAETGANTYGASLSANSGRVAFIPINRGEQFYRMPQINEINTISPTTWDRYSTGAIQCQMKLLVTKVVAANDQLPTRIEFRYQGASGAEEVRTFERGVNWPMPTEAGGATIPFQTEHTESGRKALVVYPGRLSDWLSANQGAGPLVNRSIHIGQNPARDPNIQPSVFPTVESETVAVLRESGNLSPWANGFSVVSGFRLYFSDDFNTVAITPPANSAVPAGEPFYPPVSVFAPEKRYGTTLKNRPVELTGQVGTLAQGEQIPFYPLDLKAGTYETVTESLISADLKPIVTPAQLPPIFMMNWMVTVEEIF